MITLENAYLMVSNRKWDGVTVQTTIGENDTAVLDDPDTGAWPTFVWVEVLRPGQLEGGARGYVPLVTLDVFVAGVEQLAQELHSGLWENS